MNGLFPQPLRSMVRELAREDSERILAVLVEEAEPVTAEEAARLAGMAPERARAVLARLASAGLVEEVVVVVEGGTVAYKVSSRGALLVACILEAFLRAR